MLNDGFNNKQTDNPMIGAIFTFNVPSHLKDAPDWPVEMKLQIDGWYVTYQKIDGNCTKSGIPYLYRILEHSWVEVPYKLHKFLEYLWVRAIEQENNKEEIQEGFDKLTDWLKKVNFEKPEGKVWDEVGV
ncbi:hypothetical protein KAU08_01015 [bacterium]|nr:hypothetical protein [bacterium]